MSNLEAHELQQQFDFRQHSQNRNPGVEWAQIHDKRTNKDWRGIKKKKNHLVLIRSLTVQIG